MRSVSVGVWIATGSRDEERSKSGISHFIEHMVFKGTHTRRMHHIAQRMESVGGYLNAFTSKEHTCFFARALDEHLVRTLDVTCDIILNPTFPAKELEKEKDVVIEEIKMYEDVPEDHVFDRFEQILYGDHPLGRPIVGFPATVQSLTQDDLFNHLKSGYTPDRIVIAVAGNASHDRVVDLVGRYAADFDRPKSSGTTIRAPAPVLGVTHTTEYRAGQQAHIVLGRRAYPILDPRRSALYLLNNVLGGGMSSRLNQNIREKYGYCYSIYSFANMLSDAGEFGVYMATDPSKVAQAQRLIFRELKKLATREISARQINQAKSQLKGAMMLGLESLSNRMTRLGRLEMHDQEFVSLDEVICEVDRITTKEVQEVAEDLFDQDSFSSVVFLPTGNTPNQHS